MNTFNSFCIGACMFMMFVAACSVLVGLFGVFPVTLSGGGLQGNTSSGQFENLTQNVTSTVQQGINFDALWLVGTGAAVAGAVAFSVLTNTTNLIGVWIFGTVFWSCWLKLQHLFYIGGFLDNSLGVAVVGMLWLGMMIMFVGAIIGMTSGSQTMR